MKLKLFAGALCPLMLALAQQPIPLPGQATAVAPGAQGPAPISPDAVVATFEGKSYTARQMQSMIDGLPPQFKQPLKQNPQAALNQLFLIRFLSDEAFKAKLDQQSPHKEALDALTRQYLANIALQEENNKVQISPVDQETFYEKNKDRYETAGLSVIYISFSNNPVPSNDPGAKKPLNENEAKLKAEKIVSDLKSGADFAKLAAANSDDKDSAAKGGEYATIRRADNFPAAIKDAVFKLNAGEVSPVPIRQPNGFYILKRTAKAAQPYAEVRDQIFQQLKQEKFQKWFSDLQNRLVVKIDKPEFFQQQ